MTKPWRIVVWIVAGVVGLGAVLVGGRWMYGFITDPGVSELDRDAAVQVTQAGIAALALI